MSKVPHFPDNQIEDGGEVDSLTRRPRYTHQKYFLLLISVRGCVNPRAIARLEGLGKLKKFNYLIGIRICKIPVCTIVLPRAPHGWPVLGRIELV
jgi:hypothetical protein